MRADVVIVGAGAAGCVLAARLSERRDRSVLLLEAGDEQVATAVGATRDGRSYVQGRGIGGSAAINAMIATAGEPADYDEWERVYRCAGWGWRDVRPWFRRVALPMRRARLSEVGPLARAVLASAPGAERARLNRSRSGERASVAEVYLGPARVRGNLHVRPNASVERVVLDGRRAVGVLLAGGELVDAARVFVSAGALHSPAILLRSGVEREGIGHNLHDHPSLSVPIVMRARPDQPSLAITVLVRNADTQVVPFEEATGSALMAAAMRVHSRGRVDLAGVDFNMLSDERDRDLLNGAEQRALELARTSAVAAIGTPGTAVAGHYFHAAGSCRMGAANDAMAVVDQRCRVIGYQSLVVCDASVMPNLPRANPCLPTVMIAERVSAMIAADE